MRYELVKYNDQLFNVKAKYAEHKIKPECVQELKELLECDIVLRNNGLFYYCELIPELEIIE